MYLMNKIDFRILGDSPWIRKIKNNRYVPITDKQAAFVNKDPTKNGPAMLKYLILKTGLDPLVMGSNVIDAVKAQQKAEDNGAAAYDPEADEEEEIPESPKVDAPKAPADDKAEKTKADLLAYVQGLKGRQLLAFVNDNLKITFNGAPSRDEILEAVRTKVTGK